MMMCHEKSETRINVIVKNFTQLQSYFLLKAVIYFEQIKHMRCTSPMNCKMSYCNAVWITSLSCLEREYVESGTRWPRKCKQQVCFLQKYVPFNVRNDRECPHCLSNKDEMMTERTLKLSRFRRISSNYLTDNSL